MLLQDSFVVVDKSKHLLRDFDCGKLGMNQFLSQFSYKHNRLGLSKTMVLASVEKDSNEKQTIAAYYTLAASSVDKRLLPITQSLPKYPIPVIVLARLAVDKRFQRQRLGEKTLISALQYAVHLSDNGLPMYGVIIDVLDDEAMNFYQQFDFFSLSNNKGARQLFVALKTLRQLLF